MRAVPQQAEAGDPAAQGFKEGSNVGIGDAAVDVGGVDGACTQLALVGCAGQVLKMDGGEVRVGT